MRNKVEKAHKKFIDKLRKEMGMEIEERIPPKRKKDKLDNKWIQEIQAELEQSFDELFGTDDS